MKFSVIGVAAALVGFTCLAQPAGAQGSDKDVRCMMLSNIFSQTEKEPAKKQIAAAAGLYFLGRADARLLPTQFRAALIAERKSLTPQTVGPAMTVCAQAFVARQRSLQALGKELAPAAPKK